MVLKLFNFALLLLKSVLECQFVYKYIIGTGVVIYIFKFIWVSVGLWKKD